MDALQYAALSEPEKYKAMDEARRKYAYRYWRQLAHQVMAERQKLRTSLRQAHEIMTGLYEGCEVEEEHRVYPSDGLTADWSYARELMMERTFMEGLMYGEEEYRPPAWKPRSPKGSQR